jgi:hypothetical protein
MGRYSEDSGDRNTLSLCRLTELAAGASAKYFQIGKSASKRVILIELGALERVAFQRIWTHIVGHPRPPGGG